MRVTMNSLYDQINTDLGRLVEKQADINNSIASGKIYRKPSDAPVKLTHALGVRSSIAETDQYGRNIVFARGWVKATETILQQVEDRLIRAKELAIQGANDTMNRDDRRAIAMEIETIMEEVVALGNTRQAGRYILAGSRTTGFDAGEYPFALDRDLNVTYNGNQEAIAVGTAPGLQQKINIDGKTALVESGTFKALKDLHDALMHNSNPGIQAAMGHIDHAAEEISIHTAKTGAMQNTLDTKEAIADELTFTNKERLADIEGTDIIEAANALKAAETGYQAALASASKVMKMSLVDFL